MKETSDEKRLDKGCAPAYGNRPSRRGRVLFRTPFGTPCLSCDSCHNHVLVLGNDLHTLLWIWSWSVSQRLRQDLRFLLQEGSKTRFQEGLQGQHLVCCPSMVLSIPRWHIVSDNRSQLAASHITGHILGGGICHPAHCIPEWRGVRGLSAEKGLSLEEEMRTDGGIAMPISSSPSSISGCARRILSRTSACALPLPVPGPETSSITGGPIPFQKGPCRA